MTTFDKALIALVGAVLTVVGTKFPLLADPALQSAITTGATTLLVYFVPNKLAK